MTSAVFKSFGAKARINVRHISPYSPQDGGAYERGHQMLQSLIRQEINFGSPDWVERIPYLELQLNTMSKFGSTTIFELVHNFLPNRNPQDRSAVIHENSILREYLECIWEDERQSTKERIDKRSRTLDDKLEIGQIVYILRPRTHKHGPSSKGKGIIEEILGSQHYRVRDLQSNKMKVEARHQLRSTATNTSVNPEDEDMERTETAPPLAYDPGHNESNDTEMNEHHTCTDTSDQCEPPLLMPLKKTLNVNPVRRAGDEVTLGACKLEDFPLWGIHQKNFQKDILKVLDFSNGQYIAKVCNVDPYGIVKESHEVRFYTPDTELVRLLLHPGTEHLSRLSLKIVRSSFGLGPPPRGCADPKGSN